MDRQSHMSGARTSRSSQPTRMRQPMPEPRRSGVAAPIVAGVFVVALIVGVLLGHFVLGGGSSASAAFPGATTATEDELDRVIATYSFDGKTESITVRDAIESQSSLDSAKDSDGNYTLPNADSALAVARNKILAQKASEEGITVEDDELSGYAEQILGTSDLSSLATQYGLTEDQTKEIVRESAAMYKLKEKVCTTSVSDMPEAPATPAEGEEENARADYGAYIVNLLGDEWDSTNNTWARTDGSYYEALKDETWSPDSATYSQAQMAYSVAYKAYAESASTSSSEWTSYVNGVLSQATITICTLGA